MTHRALLEHRGGCRWAGPRARPRPPLTPAEAYSATLHHRLEYRGEASAKFWDITQSGARVTVVFGRIGTTGQTQARTLGSPAAARANAEKPLAAKLAKGYRAATAAKPTKRAKPAKPAKPATGAAPYLFVGDGYGTVTAVRGGVLSREGPTMQARRHEDEAHSREVG